MGGPSFDFGTGGVKGLESVFPAPPVHNEPRVETVGEETAAEPVVQEQSVWSE